MSKMSKRVNEYNGLIKVCFGGGWGVGGEKRSLGA